MLLLLAGPLCADEPSAVESATDLLFNEATGDLHGTGAHRPDARQWAWGETNLVKVRSVRPNKLALERTGRLYKAGATAPDSELQAAPLGTEISSAPAVTEPLSLALPAAVDNSTLKYFPPIRSQGAIGSCAQFAAIYYTLTHMTAMARDWDAKNGGDTYRFSPKWTYNMLNQGEDVGSCHYDAYAIAQKHGAATWAAFPYDDDYRGWCLDPQAWRSALRVRADQVGKVEALYSPEGLSQLKQMLANGYVLNFATYICSWQWRTIGNDPATTADDAFAGQRAVAYVNGFSGSHVLTIVGYNDDIWVDLNADGQVTPDEKGALRVANSWGTNWNDRGFCWISYAALVTLNPSFPYEGLFWFDEATWITARPSYEPRLVAEFTLSHRSRSQLRMSVGTSLTSETAPTRTWFPACVLDRAGGAYAFNGGSTAMDGTFCLDLTDLAPNPSVSQRFYVSMTDTLAGNAAQLKACRLVDLEHGWELPYTVQAATADAATATVFVDCNASAVPTVGVDAYQAAEGTVVDCRSAGGCGTNDIVLSVLRNGQWVEVGRLPASGSTLYRFFVPGLAAGASYALRVQDSSGACHMPGSVKVGTFSVCAVLAQPGVMSLHWQSVAGGVYAVQRADSPAGPWTAVARVTATSETSAAEAAATSGNGSGFFKVARVE